MSDNPTLPLVDRAAIAKVWPRSIADSEAEYLSPRQVEMLYASSEWAREAADALEAAQRRVSELEAALTPSAATKAVYIGKFSFTIDEVSGDVGCEVSRKVDVPWTTIKEIMAAILARAALAKNETA